MLLGTEIKAIREGRVNLRDSYARLENGETWLLNVHVSPYSHTGYAHHEERRQRKLLLHKHEIMKLAGKVQEKGLTLVPLQMYFKGGRLKVARGSRQGQAGARQARDHSVAGNRSRDPGRDQVAKPLMARRAERRWRYPGRVRIARCQSIYPIQSNSYALLSAWAVTRARLRFGPRLT